MEPMTVGASVESVLTWDYRPADGRLATLYERAKAGQWNAATDVDWSLPVTFGRALNRDSAAGWASFRASPLARRGPRAWDTFRWELQSWMVSQFLHGEQAALAVAGRLAGELPDLDGKFCAASQAADEARHVEVFARYLHEHVPEPYPVSPPLRSLLTDVLADGRWDVTALGMQIMVEALAMAAFRLGGETFHDPLIQQITRLVARDEARHVSFGVLSLEGLYAGLTTPERGEREELVVQAAELMHRRFLLGEVWERMEVDRAEGTAHAAVDPLMVSYRRTLFTAVLSALRRIGLFTPYVRGKLALLGLVAPGIG
ncbi:MULTISPECIES: ferritin-like domain-containing protein [unclassified Streptomyces]|uniref:ferritin-like domain-containing protein n=1 Tax=unclassified Streptomyces TaxID=2593676 RepID=UPI0003828496|nr:MULTISPECIES: ferritin-like domain-containing protein [unclassified Streptomyces]MYT29243.1 ferritin-like domain-containing protein [Streptomyces sp. SID8354]